MAHFLKINEDMSIQYRDLKSQPSEYEAPPCTTRPGLAPDKELLFYY